jgi:uncharacterized protein YejL (UPF0352 family)
MLSKQQVEISHLKHNGGVHILMKSLLLGVMVAILGFIITYALARSQGIAIAMSFAAMLLVGVVITCSSLIILAIEKNK